MRPLIALICLTFSFQSIAEKPNARFHSLRIEDGLPNQTIWDIAQDNSGFIWLATTQGLVRFDGEYLANFYHDPNDVLSISHSTVRTLLVSNSGQLWAGTYNGGLNLYDSKFQTFSAIKHDPDSTDSLSSNDVSNLVEGKNGTIWVGTSNGLNKVNESTQEVIRFNSSSDTNEVNVRSLLYSSRSELWIGSANGVSILNKEETELRSIAFPINSSVLVRSLFETSSGQIWIGTNRGLFIASLDGIILTQIKELEQRTILSITESSHNSIWLGTQLNGIYHVTQNSLNDSLNIKQYIYDKGASFSINDNSIPSMYVDSANIVWIGTYSSGLNWLDPTTLQFGFYDDSINSVFCLPSPYIYSFLRDSNKNLWIGTREGLTKVNESGTCQNYSTKHGLSNKELHSIYVDKKNNFWIATAQGLSKFNIESETFTTKGIRYPKIRTYDIDETLDGRKIVGSLKGLYIGDAKDSNFQLVNCLNKNICAAQMGKIIRLDEHSFLISSDAGLLLYDEIENNLDYYRRNNKVLSFGALRALHISKDGSIWGGTNEEGLFRIKNGSTEVEYFNQIELLNEIRTFSGILSDDKDIIWVSTGLGLIKFDVNKMDARKYTSVDGLQGDIFSRRTEYEDQEGNLYFGGHDGFNVFNPKKIKNNNVPPKVVLTNFYHFDKEILPSNKDATFKLEKSIDQIDEITLEHYDYDFSISFSALHFSDYKRNKYAYKLEGFDADWKYTDYKGRKVNYTNLSPGDYIFKVKAANKDGVWNETPTELAIRVNPAPWASPFAYTIYTIILILSILSFIKYRTKSLEKRALTLENTVAERTKELATEKEKVEQLLSRKNEEFANVSHEFRTPLTLILGPINQLVTKSKDKNLVGKLNIVQRNALRLLRMVDQLLNLETFRVKSITQKSPQAIGKITQLVAEAFADLAEEKQITFNIGTIETVCFDFTPDAFEKIILNLLSNAIKYTKPGGAISISATRYENNRYQIQVSDTGIGIAKDKLEKVFERFNRVMDENSEQVTGSGIGLALVKSLVESHDGSVELESELGQGTTITVTLPIINEVDESQINVHQNDEIIAMELMNVSSSGMHESSIAQTAEAIQSTGKPTVLVIEDNDDMRQYIVESIGQQFNTLVAADGQAGLELAIQEVPDLIISDIMMPKLDGYQTTKALREAQITNHIPVVLLTARGDRDSRLKGWEEKADEYITKPFDVEELIIRISNLIEIRNILKRRFSETVFEQTEQAPESLVQEMDGDSGNLSIVEINTQKLQQEFINQLNQQIESVYMNAELGVIDLAKSVNMSERQFYRKLKSVIDMTPSEYLRRFRLEKSKEVLHSGKTANFTAFEVGFSSQAYFSKCFKAQYNLTPKQFVNQK